MAKKQSTPATDQPATVAGIPPVDPKSVGNFDRLSKGLAERCGMSRANIGEIIAENRKAHPITTPDARRTDQQAWKLGRVLRVSSTFVPDAVTREMCSNAISLATAAADGKSSLSVNAPARALIASYCGIHLETADADARARRTSPAATVKSEVQALREALSVQQAQMAQMLAMMQAQMQGAGTVKSNGRKAHADTQAATV